jgi:NhaP-type Na+/H+ or K+/H+ antiporter
MPFCMASRTTADKEGTTGVEHILLDFGLILGAGLLAQLLATLLRIPEMIVLVAVGALIGPSVLGIASNPLDEAGAQLIFTLGVSLILFHGGVGISLRVLSQVGVGLGLLALPGVLLPNGRSDRRYTGAVLPMPRSNRRWPG